MSLITTYFDPRELSGYARTALRDYPVNNPSLARWLPFSEVPDIEFRFTRGDNGLIRLAPFRTYDTEASIAGRKGLTRETRALPPISRKIVLSEYDQLIRRARPDEAIREAILSDVDELVREIVMSFEFEMGDALNTGTVTPPGLNETITFSRSGGNSVTANTLWSNLGSSDPISDLRAWAKYYRQKNGAAPGTLLMSEDSLTFLLQSLAVRSLVGTGASIPTMIDEATLGTILSRNRLPQIETYEVQYDSTGNGSAARILPNNVVLLLPPATDPTNPAGTKLGATVIGTPLEASKPEYHLEDSQAGIVVGNHEDDDPPSIWTRASAIGLVNLMNPDLSFKAVVA